MRVPDESVLFAKWLRDPFRIGAVVPSGASLARSMAAAVDHSRPGAVLELGGGTGAVTKALLRSGIPPCDLAIIERDAELYQLLRKRFPGSHVIHGDAMQAKDLLAAAGIDRVKAVVSGLPLLTMKPRTQMRILRQCVNLLDEDGVIVQFTYGPASPVPERRLARMGLEARLADRVWLNVPPAAVWRFERIGKTVEPKVRRRLWPFEAAAEEPGFGA
jgi:phosphatidylethanolamine/phosphatidyl-N-methylethanolamine N-methyltransferase